MAESGIQSELVVRLGLSLVCTVFTVIMFKAPLADIKVMQAASSTLEFTFLPYLAMLMNCICWTVYGILLLDPLVGFVNLFGVMMASYYCFRHMGLSSSNKEEKLSKARVQSMIGAVFVASVLVYSVSMGNAPFLGFVSSTMAVLMFAAPLAVIVDVVRRKNASALSKAYAGSMLIAATSWTIYGLFIVNDLNIAAPNGLGLIFASTQLYLIALYSSDQEVLGTGSPTVPVAEKKAVPDAVPVAESA